MLLAGTQNGGLPTNEHVMEFLPLIDLQLKSEEIIDVLERHDMEVVYQFDRDFEGADDEYQSSSASGGFEFVFDATQRLATVFLYIRPRGEFAAIDVASIDVPVYPCIDAARDAFENGGDAIRQGDGWIKAFVAGVWRHYEFDDGELSLITLMRDPV